MRGPDHQMNPKLFAIAKRLHVLHSAQGRHVARILALRGEDTDTKHGRVTNSKPTKAKPATVKGATVSRREFVADAQSTKEEMANQRAYFRLWDSLEDVETGNAADLLSEYDDDCRRLAESAKAQEALASAKAGKDATVATVKAQAAKAAKAGVPA